MVTSKPRGRSLVSSSTSLSPAMPAPTTNSRSRVRTLRSGATPAPARGVGAELCGKALMAGLEPNAIARAIAGAIAKTIARTLARTIARTIARGIVLAKAGEAVEHAPAHPLGLLGDPARQAGPGLAGGSGRGPSRYSAACSAGALCRAYRNSSTAARAWI